MNVRNIVRREYRDPQQDQLRKQIKRAVRMGKERAHLAAISGLEFRGFGKIARLNREIIITEKIDGTQGAIGIVTEAVPGDEGGKARIRVYAQSHTRLLSPFNDNMGFAAWVEANWDTLISTLGPGLHFGEWWGRGIQRGYGLSEKRFSLFDVEKWDEKAKGHGALDLANARLNGCSIHCVPVLWRGPWLSPGVVGFCDDADPKNEDGTPKWSVEPGNPRQRYTPNFALEWLAREGSQAAPGYMNPEGIVIYHKASQTYFKATIKGDEKPKRSQEIA
jgi:hypothetical protein